MASKEVSDAGIYGYGTYDTTVFFSFFTHRLYASVLCSDWEKKKVCKCIRIYTSA